MERTIDGIDYIAKSEVLRLIDEELEYAQKRIDDPAVKEEQWYGWGCRKVAMRMLRNRLTKAQER